MLKELLPEQLAQKDVQQSAWESALAQSQSLDFSDPHLFESSGKGRKRIQDAILIAIGKKQLSEIQDDSFRDYLAAAIKEAPHA